LPTGAPQKKTPIDIKRAKARDPYVVPTPRNQDKSDDEAQEILV